MKYSIEQLEEAIVSSVTWGEVCRKIGAKAATGSQTALMRRCKKLGIDTSHFLGQSWRKGREFVSEQIPLEKYLSNELSISSHNLKLKLIKKGLKEECCEICKLSEWNGEKIVLELDHINSNHYDNRLDNLQILCPNCHALETRLRRVKKKKPARKRNNKAPKLSIRKVERPSLNIILEDVKDMGYSKTGRKYGVSDNCIRKWIKWESAGTVDNSVLETEAK